MILTTISGWGYICALGNRRVEAVAASRELTGRAVS
jgi:hypothetical protein